MPLARGDTIVRRTAVKNGNVPDNSRRRKAGRQNSMWTSDDETSLQPELQT
jgi:hypothetical protein